MKTGETKLTKTQLTHLDQNHFRKYRFPNWSNLESDLGPPQLTLIVMTVRPLRSLTHRLQVFYHMTFILPIFYSRYTFHGYEFIGKRQLTVLGADISVYPLSLLTTTLITTSCGVIIVTIFYISTSKTEVEPCLF